MAIFEVSWVNTPADSGIFPKRHTSRYDSGNLGREVLFVFLFEIV